MIICGIDPGKKGAIAFIMPGHTGDHRIEMMVMPEDLGEVVAKLEWMRASDSAIHVFIEKAQAMPGNGGVSMFNYGRGFGELLGVICALGIPHTQVPPKTWAKAMHAGTKDGTAKERSLEAAQRLFPRMKFTATDRCKKPHDGLVDALMIAEYGRRTLARC